MGAGTVYLIHLHSPLGHAHHYIGWAKNAKRRFAHHQAGTGSRMLAVANERGITYQIARTWPGDRAFERLLKNRKNARRYCPICNPKLANTNPNHTHGNNRRRSRSSEAGKPVGVLSY